MRSFDGIDHKCSGSAPSNSCRGPENCKDDDPLRSLEWAVLIRWNLREKKLNEWNLTATNITRIASLYRPWWSCNLRRVRSLVLYASHVVWDRARGWQDRRQPTYFGSLKVEFLKMFLCSCRETIEMRGREFSINITPHLVQLSVINKELWQMIYSSTYTSALTHPKL